MPPLRGVLPARGLPSCACKQDYSTFLSSPLGRAALHSLSDAPDLALGSCTPLCGGTALCRWCRGRSLGSGRLCPGGGDLRGRRRHDACRRARSCGLGCTVRHRRPVAHVSGLRRVQEEDTCAASRLSRIRLAHTYKYRSHWPSAALLCPNRPGSARFCGCFLSRRLFAREKPVKPTMPAGWQPSR